MDPRYAGGKGERAFINNIGIAKDFKPGNIDDSFFNSYITVFGGTALVPNIHDKLQILLEKAKRNGCLTIVHTVFDFRNEKNNPGKPWPLVETEKSFPLIDLLIVDHEEALKISGTDAVKKASEYFISEKVPALLLPMEPTISCYILLATYSPG
ncbi:MAG: hypothetical protein MI975_03865 [Cytophagales bacterium]|nr:hypothetical protein [Cytophagales bacterium]